MGLEFISSLQGLGCLQLQTICSPEAHVGVTLLSPNVTKPCLGFLWEKTCILVQALANCSPLPVFAQSVS